MLAIERRNAILEKLQEEKRVVVSELSTLFEVSEETIRRDLDKLEKEGLVIKSYGGAVPNENSNLDLPFNIRKNRNVVGKQIIAELISEMVRDGENIFLDASSTAVAIAKKLKDKKELTVITNSLEISVKLSETPTCKIISTGGEVIGSSLALVGQMTDREIRTYNVDKAILSAKAIDLEAGFSDSDERLAYNKKSMLEGARVKILAIDHSKFGKFSFVKVGDLRDIDFIVTDKKPGNEWLEKFGEYNIECVYPEDII